MPLICVHVKEPALKQAVIDEIRWRDTSAELDGDEGSKLHYTAVPTTFWIDTEIPHWEVEQIGGVTDAVLSYNVCSCGSGERRDELRDARGIFCCFYCSACEAEKRGRYRTEVLEDSDYQCDEQIEADY